jgi:hypothetical protein
MNENENELDQFIKQLGEDQPKAPKANAGKCAGLKGLQMAQQLLLAPPKWEGKKEIPENQKMTSEHFRKLRGYFRRKYGWNFNTPDPS